MDSQDLRNLQEAYSNVYEQKIGVPLKDASDRAAKEQLKRMIPKGEKIHTPKATLQNAAYEPEGDEIEEDVRSRDVNARGGFDPRFDKRPKPTTGGQVRTPGGPVSTPGGPVKTPTPGPVAQAPKPGGLLGSLDKMARDTAGEIGGRIGEREGRNRTGNIPVISDIGGAIGRNKGRQQGQQMYDKAKETVGGLLKQDYEFDNFDVILEYLVAEGYADTNENALVIMANMSEEWKQTILEAEVLAQKGGVPGSVKVRPSISIPGTSIGIGPNKPVPGTFTTTTPGQREKIKQGDTQIDTGVGGMKSREGAGPTAAERERYNREAIRTGARRMAR
jgi:hypothetical protein